MRVREGEHKRGQRRARRAVIAVELNSKQTTTNALDFANAIVFIMAIKRAVNGLNEFRIEINDKIRCQPGDKHNGWSRKRGFLFQMPLPLFEYLYVCVCIV